MTTAHMGNPTTYSYPPDGLSGIVRYDSRTSTYTPYAIETDHLGSITALYNSSGTKVMGASFDAWGKRTQTTSTLEFRRGFTGHEHIDGFDLINMNGRVYDPLIGRFLSPDMYVQLPGFSQSFNRYSYCLNNPLKYTDPSGERISWLWGLALGLNLIPIESAMAFITVSTTDAITSGTIGLFNGGFDEAAKRATNSVKLATAMIESDESDGGELAQFGRSYFRSIWCSPISLFGYVYCTYANFFTRMDIETYYGATVITSKAVKDGVTFGHYIIINPKNEGNEFTLTLIHEYGRFETRS